MAQGEAGWGLGCWAGKVLKNGLDTGIVAVLLADECNRCLSVFGLRQTFGIGETHNRKACNQPNAHFFQCVLLCQFVRDRFE